jgi:hypothetical protein
MRTLWERIVEAAFADFPYEDEANLSRLDRMDGRDA